MKTVPLKILILGAGATGKVYQEVLEKAGCEVHLFTRTSSLGVFDERNWDYVFLCVSSPALQENSVMALIERATRSSAILVAIQSGSKDLDYIKSKVPERQLIFLTVSFISFRDPERKDLVVYFPKWMKARVESKSERADEFIDLLRHGGMAAMQVNSVLPEVAVPDVILNVFVFELEKASWDLDRLLSDRRKMKAMAERMRVYGSAMAKKTGARGAFALRFIGPIALGLGIRMMRKSLPFDLETMLKAHFSRHTSQTAARLVEYDEAARAQEQ